jgi:phenylalanyl-tRNA synthetase alpha chain
MKSDGIVEAQKEALENIGLCQTSEDLETFRIKWLGSKGKIKKILKSIGEADEADRPRLGQHVNALRQEVQAAFEAKKAGLGAKPQAAKGPMLDITEPGLSPRLGRRHIITQTIDELVEVFGRMGFDVATGPELEDEFHNFVALNIPMEHPARDPLDNFYVDATHLLRSQTSTIQIRVMEKQPPPVRIVAMGRVYRPDEHDATHYSMFHQVEGLYVDHGVSMVDLKTTLIQFAHAMFGPEADVRLRPSFFPFTEPSAELEVKMDLKGTGQLEWMEIGGCGMVDPNVFTAVGYDPEEWTGFAFGLGIERLAMRKYGISDIRWLYENDVRFLRQF